MQLQQQQATVMRRRILYPRILDDVGGVWWKLQNNDRDGPSPDLMKFDDVDVRADEARADTDLCN